MQSAQDKLAAISQLVESAKIGAAATAESQALTATALSDAQVKLTEISTAATEAAASKAQITENQTAILEFAKIAAESQGLAATALTDAQAKLVEISTAATQAVAATTKITDFQAVIATKSDHIQDAQVHADKVRADLDRALTAATQQVTATEAEKATAQSAAENAAKLLVDIQTASVVSD